MDIHTQVEIVLREAGYDTWPWQNNYSAVTCFESQAIAGFVHVFDDCDTLLKRWRESQQRILQRYAAALRPAGAKAWNVYSIFLTSEPGSMSHAFEIEKIEEDFTLTRKIARCNVRIAADIANALLPLLPMTTFEGIAVIDYEAQLRRRLSEVDSRVASAFLSSKSVAEIAALMIESS